MKKGDDAPLLLKQSKNFEEIRDLYDKLHDDANAVFDWNVEELRRKQADFNGNMQLLGNGQANRQDSGPTVREGGSNNGRGSGANLLESNSGKGIADDERSAGNGGALSNVKKSIAYAVSAEEYEGDYFLDTATPDEIKRIVDEVDRRPALQDEQIITLQEQINELTGQRDNLLIARMILIDIIKYSLTFCGFSV